MLVTVARHCCAALAAPFGDSSDPPSSLWRCSLCVLSVFLSSSRRFFLPTCTCSSASGRFCLAA